ncbi:hypothetical protein AB0J52_24640 [Spirillospora sp. NPDC049652]
MKINLIGVPEGPGADLERRVAENIHETEGAKGLLSHELLRSTDGAPTSVTR